MSSTFSPEWSERPKSPCASWPRYTRNCTRSGWSSPYFASSAACSWGVRPSGYICSNGVPEKRTVRNAITSTRNMVTTARARRMARKRSMAGPLQKGSRAAHRPGADMASLRGIDLDLAGAQRQNVGPVGDGNVEGDALAHGIELVRLVEQQPARDFLAHLQQVPIGRLTLGRIGREARTLVRGLPIGVDVVRRPQRALRGPRLLRPVGVHRAHRVGVVHRVGPAAHVQLFIVEVVDLLDLQVEPAFAPLLLDHLRGEIAIKVVAAGELGDDLLAVVAGLLQQGAGLFGVVFDERQ